MPFDLSKIKNICEKYNLWLIEDCCDALGSKYEDQHVGTFGDIATLSFYPAHHITMGEGGAVFTNHTNLKKIAESFRLGGVIVIVYLAKKIHVAKDINGKKVLFLQAMTTNTYLAIADTT